MPKALFTKRGNTCGFDSDGRAIVGWYGKDRLWHVGQVKEHDSEYLTNGTHRLFDTNAAASEHAAALIDPIATQQLKWWN